MTTGRQVIKRARRAIQRDEAFIYDVAAEHGLIVGNVRHMSWFVEAVGDALIDNTRRGGSHAEDV